jgi:hypothetical protein
MKTLVISYWYGRLGNNIIQVKNALHIALYSNYNVIIPQHLYFKCCELNVAPNNEDTPIEYIYGNDCYQFYGNYNLVNNECYSMNNEKVRDILINLFTIDYKILEPLGEDELVIHIRSGDAVVGNGLHPQYIIPPLSYFTKYIESNQYKRIYILAEDNHNTCIDALKNKYKNIDFELRTLTNDISLILRGRNVMMSVGSFVPALLWVTKTTKTIIYPSYDEFICRAMPLKEDSLEFNSIDLTEYYNVVKGSNDNNETRLARTLLM